MKVGDLVRYVPRRYNSDYTGHKGILKQRADDRAPGIVLNINMCITNSGQVLVLWKNGVTERDYHGYLEVISEGR